MHLEWLAGQADEARKAVEMARARLERTARRWAERPAGPGLRELQQAAEQFEGAQRQLEDALRAWARALGTPELTLAAGSH
jgi:hypothetical protein